MSSNKGIIRFNKASKKITNFLTADGLQSDEFNTWAYSKTPDGTFLFGGVKGLNVFHPNEFKDNPIVPNVLITGLEINNDQISNLDSTNILKQSIEYTKELTLSFRQNSIVLEFAALEFSAPKKNKFQFYLEGSEVPWVHESVDLSLIHI